MWKSQIQYKWERAAVKIGKKIKINKKVNVFIDYLELPLYSKVQDLEEILPPHYKVRFYK